MKNAAREAKVAEPEFEFSGFFKVTFKRNKMIQSIETSDGRAIASDWRAIASDWQAIGISDRKHVILSCIEERGHMATTEIADVLGLSKVRVRAILKEMVSDGTIQKVGSNRYAYYVLNKAP